VQERALAMSEPRLIVESLDNGLFRLSITRNEQTQYVDVGQLGSAQIAAKILQMAAHSLTQSGRPRIDHTKQFTEWASAFPTTLGFGQSQIPNHESLLLQFGNAILAIPIEKSQLHQLGQALVALSANAERSH
jgi:hypothetical protein